MLDTGSSCTYWPYLNATTTSGVWHLCCPFHCLVEVGRIDDENTDEMLAAFDDRSVRHERSVSTGSERGGHRRIFQAVSEDQFAGRRKFLGDLAVSAEERFVFCGAPILRERPVFVGKQGVVHGSFSNFLVVSWMTADVAKSGQAQTTNLKKLRC
jgi:hypothetical protein